MSEPTTYLPPDWHMQESRAIAVRPATLGLPLGFAAILVVVCLQLAFTLKLWGAALFVFGAGWGIGKLLVSWDPFAWEIFVADAKMPKVLLP